MTIYVRRVERNRYRGRPAHDPYQNQRPGGNLALRFCPVVYRFERRPQKTIQLKTPLAEGFNSGKATIGTGPFKFVSWEPKGDSGA